MNEGPREQLQPYIAFAFVEFGMSESDFLRQTPNEWMLIMEAWRNRERRTDRRVARLCSVFVGGSEDDFMPRLSFEDEEQSVDEMIESLKAAGQKQNGK